MQLWWGDKGAEQFEIIEVQHNMTLCGKHKEKSSTEFLHVSKFCKKRLTKSESTYVSETGFSAITNTKKKIKLYYWWAFIKSNEDSIYWIPTANLWKLQAPFKA